MTGPASTRIPRLTLVVTLLVTTLGLAGALAWQAHRAARSHHDAAERVLRDYVGFAGWEFSRAARRQLEVSIDRWLDTIVCAAGERRLVDPARMAARAHCGCGSDFTPGALFALDMRSGELTATGAALGDDAQAWIRSTAASRGSHAATPHSRVVTVEALDGGTRAIAGRFVRAGGSHVMFAGFVAESSALGAAFARVLEGSPLLPATLAGSSNDMLGLRVSTPAGDPVFTSGEASGPVWADGVLDDAVGGLAYRITLQPDAAGQLIIGGLPRSRLPLLLGLLGLTAGLLLVAVLQLRREHDLARLRTDFVSSVTHELRTPLAQIRLFSETLLLGRVRSEAEGRRSLEIIQQESRRLAHLVDNVLYFSRTAHGTPSLSPVRTSLGGLIRDVLEMFEPLAHAARATVRLEVRQDGPAMVDPGAFRQILLNLLDNAVKYGRSGQAIVVTLDRAADEVVLTVDDEGAGVPSEARDRIWQPYWRLASAATSGVAGTGIGLAVVRDLSRLHGGTADVAEAPGGGARFIIRLPAPGAYGERTGTAETSSVPA